jgi:hypothetical protein
MDICVQLRALAMQLDYEKIISEQAYTLGTAAPGLVPNISLFSP